MTKQLNPNLDLDSQVDYLIDNITLLLDDDGYECESLKDYDVNEDGFYIEIDNILRVSAYDPLHHWVIQVSPDIFKAFNNEIFPDLIGFIVDITYNMCFDDNKYHQIESEVYVSPDIVIHRNEDGTHGWCS